MESHKIHVPNHQPVGFFNGLLMHLVDHPQLGAARISRPASGAALEKGPGAHGAHQPPRNHWRPLGDEDTSKNHFQISHGYGSKAFKSEYIYDMTL